MRSLQVGAKAVTGYINAIAWLVAEHTETPTPVVTFVVTTSVYSCRQCFSLWTKPT